MRIRDEIRIGVVVLLAIQVLTMIAAVALMSRMTPAIDDVLENNEKSIRAVERMLLVLAEPSLDTSARFDRFERALEEAQNNITEDGETRILEDIEARYEQALVGDPDAMAIVRTELGRLADLNRDSMFEANLRVKRLGTAGAWALVFLGLIGMVFSMQLMRRARVKLIQPVYELSAVLSSCSAGDIHRRFNPVEASREFRDVAEVVNQLVSEHFAQLERGWDPRAQLDRVALLQLLDRTREPTFVCDPFGGVAAANDAALDAMAGAGGEALRRSIAQACRGEPVDGLRVEPLGEAGLLCSIPAQRAGVGSTKPGAASAAGTSPTASAPVSSVAVPAKPAPPAAPPAKPVPSAAPPAKPAPPAAPPAKPAVPDPAPSA